MFCFHRNVLNPKTIFGIKLNRHFNFKTIPATQILKYNQLIKHHGKLELPVVNSCIVH